MSHLRHTEQRKRFRAILNGTECLSPASVYDPLSARVAESVGYKLGILAGSVRALHEAGLWNHLQTTAFDLSGVLPVDGGIGTLLSGLFGYSDRPAIGEVIAYALFLAVTLYLFLAEPRTTTTTPKAAPHKASRA